MTWLLTKIIFFSGELNYSGKPYREFFICPSSLQKVNSVDLMEDKVNNLYIFTCEVDAP